MAFIVLVWIWGLVQVIRASKARRRRLKEGATLLAQDLGLTIGGESQMEGEVDAVAARLLPGQK